MPKVVVIVVRVPVDKMRDATDMLNGSVGVALDALEDQGLIGGWEYGKQTLDEVISGKPFEAMNEGEFLESFGAAMGWTPEMTEDDAVNQAMQRLGLTPEEVL